jgi:hypothetical protein
MKNKVQRSTKTGIKKKIELMESKPTVIKIISDKRPPLKTEILEKLTALKETYDALDCENKKNINLIKCFQEEITLLKNQKSTSNKGMKGSQTFTPYFQICCNICIYVATCKKELNWHMGEDHVLFNDSYLTRISIVLLQLL